MSRAADARGHALFGAPLTNFYFNHHNLYST